FCITVHELIDFAEDLHRGRRRSGRRGIGIALMRSMGAGLNFNLVAPVRATDDGSRVAALFPSFHA
ncbi:hypothetical protein FOZ63_003973, partial [Perkinsus olseni]